MIVNMDVDASYEHFMNWIAPTEKDTAAATLEKRLWDAADQFRANSGLEPQEYSGPILGLVFLRFSTSRKGNGLTWSKLIKP